MEFTNHIHFSKELENAILGACILEKEAFGRTFGIIEQDSFYHDGNKIIYDALADMYSNGFPIDLLTVNDFIQNKKEITEINGSNIPFVLCQITKDVVSSAHLEYHCFIVKRMWMGRELIKLTHGGLKLEGEVKEQISQLNEAIQNINQGTFKKEWFDMSELMYDLMKHQEEMKKTKGMGITTGIATLDQENGGFFGGQMIVIGARPSVGKSAFMGQLAIGMAKTGKRIGIISLEMNNNEIAARLSALETQDDFKTIFRNLYRDEDHRAAWYDKIRTITDLPIFVSDKTKVSPIDIKAKVAKLKHLHGLDCLMIDYLQLVGNEEDRKNRTRENEVSVISRSCKLLSKDLNIPIILLAQLNRAVTQRKGLSRYPTLSDLRESGSIEQDADVVMFLHRDWLLGEEYTKDENGDSTENKADLIIRKWRNGASNLHIPLFFDAPKMMFRNGNQAINHWKPESVDYQQDNPF